MSKISHTEPSQHCNITHWTHIEKRKWFNSSAMLYVLSTNNLGFGILAWLWLKSVQLLASSSATQTWHVQNQPHRAFPQHCNIPHWTHMEEMKWFNSSAMLYVLAANNLGFGFSLALAEISQTFGEQQCLADMACPKSATQSLPSIVTSLIGPIWRT
jgi:nitrous oxide reductase accessory protein NosL